MAGVLDEAAEDGVGNAGHRREDGRRGDGDRADGKARGNWLQWRCQASKSARPVAVTSRDVPGLSHVVLWSNSYVGSMFVDVAIDFFVESWWNLKSFRFYHDLGNERVPWTSLI